MTATVEETITVPNDVSAAGGPEVAHALCAYCYNQRLLPDSGVTVQAICGVWIDEKADEDAVQCGRCRALFDSGPCARCGRTW